MCLMPLPDYAKLPPPPPPTATMLAAGDFDPSERWRSWCFGGFTGSRLAPDANRSLRPFDRYHALGDDNPGDATTG
jgi:hypothetical protein